MESDAEMAEPEEGEEGSQEQDVDQELTLTQVWCIRRGKRQWFPTTQVCGGRTYVKVSKYDRGLCHLVLGQSMQRHSKKSQVTLKRKWFQEMAHSRRKECQNALNHQIAENAKESGHEPPKKIRLVRADDAYLVGESVLVQQGPVEDGEKVYGGRNLRILWLNKTADLWVEMTKDNVEYMIAAIRTSPPEEPRPILGWYMNTLSICFVYIFILRCWFDCFFSSSWIDGACHHLLYRKGSPKRRRRLKRRHSEPHEGDDQQEASTNWFFHRSWFSLPTPPKRNGRVKTDWVLGL